MAVMVGEWFSKIDPAMHLYKAHLNAPSASHDFINFKAADVDHLKLLFCIDMLNEGVHVEDMDEVILFHPTVSSIIYKQQIGRALSENKMKVSLKQLKQVTITSVSRTRSRRLCRHMYG